MGDLSCAMIHSQMLRIIFVNSQHVYFKELNYIHNIIDEGDDGVGRGSIKTMWIYLIFDIFIEMDLTKNLYVIQMSQVFYSHRHRCDNLTWIVGRLLLRDLFYQILKLFEIIASVDTS